jgi:hypothetical protein
VITAGDELDGRYRVLSRVGAGAFGEVFLAEDVRLGRRVVVKVLGDAGPGPIARLAKEFRLLSRLDDAAFARVYGVGQIADGRPYLVTEWVEGRTLDQVLPTLGGRVPLASALALAQTIARGLATLHNAGFVHRDIKPSNVMIPGGESPGEEDFRRAKLLDFGVIGVLLEEGGGHLTRTGELVGTPRYMAPEQIRALPQSPATDVYGLALLLVEMLYGRLPFEGTAESTFALMARIVQTDPDLPVDPAVPEPVRALLVRSLNRDPSLRPGDGAAFLEELQAVAVPAADTGSHHIVPRPVPLGAHRSSRPSGRVRQLESPRPMSRAAGRTLLRFATAALVAAVVIWWATLGPVLSLVPLLWIGAGIALAAGSPFLASAVRRVARSRLHSVDMDVERLLLGLSTRRSLSDTIQVEVTQIIARCRDLDERLLSVTIVRMIDEYDAATASDDRQAALMNVAALLDKLRGRMSPWYARLEKQLALATSVVGIASGFVSVVTGVLKIVQAP